jgi:poly-gamma-glutamate capsule biosynthesis protein CapA/YwtB (metallophosphatase superfamily)
MDRRRFLAAGLAAGAAGPAAAAAPLRITLLGQALIQHDICGQAWPSRGEFTRMLRKADVVFSDLETALRTPQAGAPTRDPELLHAAPVEVLDCLKGLGVNLLATANNHAWDLGTAGIAGGLPPLDTRGLAHAGTGLDLAQAAAPAYRRTRRGTVALVAMATGAVREGAAATPSRPGVNEVRRDPSGALNEEDVARVLSAVATSARQADVVMLYHHNHYWEPDNRVTPAWQKALARRAIDAGGGLFVSHGAPVLHGIELYRGRPIFYDLGSYIFQTRTPEGRYGDGPWESLVVECEYSAGRFQRCLLTPVALNPVGVGGPTDFETRGRPAIARGAHGEAILDRLSTLCAANGLALSRRPGQAAFQA